MMIHPLQAYPNLSVHISTASPTHTTVFEKVVLIDAEPHVVWKLLTRPSDMIRWNRQIKQVFIYLAEDSRNGTSRVGCEQKVFLQTGRPVEQVITDWIPQVMVGYATVEGSMHKGFQTELEIETYKLRRVDDGTELHYLCYLEYDRPLQGKSALRRFYRENRNKLHFLKWIAEHTRADF